MIILLIFALLTSYFIVATPEDDGTTVGVVKKADHVGDVDTAELGHTLSTSVKAIVYHILKGTTFFDEDNGFERAVAPALTILIENLRGGNVKNSKTLIRDSLSNMLRGLHELGVHIRPSQAEHIHKDIYRIEHNIEVFYQICNSSDTVTILRSIITNSLMQAVVELTEPPIYS
ncbi:hypothetical protein PENTCL1PPCAC_14456 [Pristionchus entomophagus]|uniref:Uncharacterized protein n=1 Tax=Pristionchus entomophagus TaxID=358040 RepID=A0AAV5T9P7_9BILA|nr:hypothetical protein PENTCL1PPCAC_14456 [Pristionchus entomophagus]